MLRRSAMYNLQVSTALAVAGGPVGAAPGLAVDPQAGTPRTPEILNSLMAMSHPLDPYANAAASSPAAPGGSELSLPSAVPCAAPSGPCGPSPCQSPPSLQHTRSQLIKEGLKLTLQTKRRHTSATSGASGSGASADEDDESASSGKRTKGDELTPEDEERRRRRRERNKVAATKCRIKKRERTVNLVQESEILESQNYELKSQIQELESQRRRLVDMLSTHSSTCTRHGHHQPVQGAAHARPVGPVGPVAPAYDMYSPTTPFSPSSDLGHGHGPQSYGDVLMGQYGASTAEEEPLPPYFPKHEIAEEPLLAALDDPLDMYVGYPSLAGVDHQPYCRPGTLALDTPASTPGSTTMSTTPGSLDSPHHHVDHSALPMGPAGPAAAPYQQQHMLGAPLSPGSASGVFGMGSGCMA